MFSNSNGGFLMKKFILVLLTFIFVSCNVYAHECESATECAIIGKKFIEQKEYKNAIECFNKAIEMDENEYFAYAYRAKANYYLKNYDQTLKDADKSIEIKPNSVAYGMKSSVNILKGNFHEAIENSSKALELNPKYAKCYEVRAKAEFETADYINALKDSNKAINLKQDLILCHQIKAKSYENLKDYLSAKESCEKSAKSFKENHDRKNYNKMRKLAKYYESKIK